MRQTIFALVKKEFLQVFRDFTMLRLIILVPIIQLIIFGYTVNIDVKYIYTNFYDFDHSAESREYLKAFSPGDYFIPRNYDIPLLESDRGFKENTYNTVMVIPDDFSEKIINREPVDVGLVVDGSNANSASIAIGYANIITMQYNRMKLNLPEPLSVRQVMLYNPEAESVYFMVPGIVVVLLTMITVMLTSMAIVREREIGTLEQLMVTPMSVPALILGKTIPFALIGFFEMSLALFIGVTWFNIPFAGSWLLLYVLAFFFLLTTLGVGMFISTITSTQQQAMFFAWFFMVFSMLTSGFFTPIANMPESVQYLTYLNPLRYFMVIVRGIMMKGAGIDTLYPQILALFTFGVVVFGFSWMRFSKRVS